MKYRSSNPRVRELLDRPRWQEWLEFELEHIRRQCMGFSMTLADFKPEALEWDYYHDACLKAGSHEMVELLSRMAEVIPVQYHRYLHRGLTSSSVIDSCNHRRWNRLAYMYKHGVHDLRALAHGAIGVGISGFTHGRLAQMTSIMQRFASVFSYICWDDLPEAVTGGPVGNNQHRQCYSRSAYIGYWSRYMSASAMLSQLALDYRFYATGWLPGVSLEFAGTSSSAMPGKCNPSEFERINSLDLLIRSICTSLMNIPPMWLERDLVHSALEREQVDRLWEYLFYQVEEMTRLVSTTKIVVDPSQQFKEPTFDLMNAWLDAGSDWPTARKLAADGVRPGTSG